MLLLLLTALQVAADALPAPTYRIDPMTVTIVGGMIVTIITAIVTGVVSIITAMRVTQVGAQGAQTASQLVSVAKDTETIKGHVNSEKTAATGREHALQQENRLLREMIADKSVTASLLAQAAAGRSASRATDAAPLGGGATPAPIPVEVVNTPLVVEPVPPSPPQPEGESKP